MINFGVFLCILGHVTTDQAGSTIARWCLDRKSHTGQWASIYSKLRRFSDVFRFLQLQDWDVNLQRHPCDTKCTVSHFMSGFSARAISLCRPETLILRRSFYNPPRLQPWCQRSILVWILSHWNIEGHLGLKSVVVSVVSAAKREHADNPTMGAEKLFCLRSLETPMHQITSETVLNVGHFMANGIPRPSAGCNFSPNQFRLIIPPEAEKSAQANNYAWCHFGQIHPQDISKMKSLKKKSGTGSFARFTPNYAWITPSFAWVFFSRKNGKMQNAVPFSCRLKVSPELGISPAGCFSLPWRSKTIGFVWSLKTTTLCR